MKPDSASLNFTLCPPRCGRGAGDNGVICSLRLRESVLAEERGCDQSLIADAACSAWLGRRTRSEEATGGTAGVAERCGKEKGLGASRFPHRDWEMPPAECIISPSWVRYKVLAGCFFVCFKRGDKKQDEPEETRASVFAFSSQWKHRGSFMLMCKNAHLGDPFARGEAVSRLVIDRRRRYRQLCLFCSKESIRASRFGDLDPPRSPVSE